MKYLKNKVRGILNGNPTEWVKGMLVQKGRRDRITENYKRRELERSRKENRKRNENQSGNPTRLKRNWKTTILKIA